MTGKHFMSASELGRKAGLSKSTVTRLERGGTKASFPTVRAIAKALDVTPQELLGTPPEQAS